jgi:hypothetical protein
MYLYNILKKIFSAKTIGLIKLTKKTDPQSIKTMINAIPNSKPENAIITKVTLYLIMHRCT